MAERNSLLQSANEQQNYGYQSLEIGDNLLSQEHNKESEEIFNLDNDSSFLEKLSIIITCSIPVISTLLMSVIGMSITLFFAGILSTNAGNSDIFAAISLGSTFANLTFNSIVEGFSSAIETLSSQHNGAKNYAEVGMTLQQSIAALALISIPLLLTWVYSDVIFLSMGVEAKICSITHGYFI
jgi:Na+-driven multidrug efflux pump